MKPGFILLNLLLVAGIGLAGWQARVRWDEARAARISALNAKVKAGAMPPLAPEPRPEAPRAATYVDVATNNLFSKDRNPTVVIEPVKVEQPKPMPPLPVIYGVLGLPSGIRAMIAEKPGAPSRSVRAGDTVGEFRIASLDPQTVVFDWEGKQISKKIEDLMDRSTHGEAGNPAPPGPGVPPPPGLAAAAPQPGNPPPANNPPPQGGSSSPLGKEIGSATQSQRSCNPGDQSPPGTVLEGYRKMVTATPFGTHCAWVQVQ